MDRAMSRTLVIHVTGKLEPEAIQHILDDLGQHGGEVIVNEDPVTHWSIAPRQFSVESQLGRVVPSLADIAAESNACFDEAPSTYPNTNVPRYCLLPRDHKGWHENGDRRWYHA